MAKIRPRKKLQALAINEEVFNSMKSKNTLPSYIVGATNQPYASSEIRKKFEDSNVFHVPESISSAGAILADSLEWTHPEHFRGKSHPSIIYSWIRNLSIEKTSELILKSDIFLKRLYYLDHQDIDEEN